jgi:hypothetical protein
LLRATLPRVMAAPGDACVDAERLAAWSEGTLPKADAATVELHLSECVRCQAMVAVFARTEPPVAAAPSMWRSPVRWLLPLAAGAVAVFIWSTLPNDDAVAPATALQTARVEPSDTRFAAQESSAANRGDESAKDELRQAREIGERATGSRSSEIDAISPARRAAPPPPSSAPVPAPPAPAPAASALLDASPEQQLAANQRAAPGAEPAGNRGGMGRGGAAGAPTVDTVGAVSGAGASVSLIVIEVTPVNAARAGGQLSDTSRGRSVVAPGPRVRWRIVGTNRVERSIGDGPWQSLAIDPPAALTGGHAPSPAVCWLVGAGGLVLRSTDGINFERVPFPQTVNLSSIRAVDARQATVTATNGRTFTTVDGGATWKP